RPRPAPAERPPERRPAEATPTTLIETPRTSRRAPEVSVPPAVIPLVHVPDDPGPEPEPRNEPETEGPDKPSDSWSRLPGMLKERCGGGLNACDLIFVGAPRGGGGRTRARGPPWRFSPRLPQADISRPVCRNSSAGRARHS